MKIKLASYPGFPVCFQHACYIEKKEAWIYEARESHNDEKILSQHAATWLTLPVSTHVFNLTSVQNE